MDDYCEHCCREGVTLLDRGDGEMWCAKCIDNYDPTPWEIDSEENWPRDESHRMKEARRMK